jgi:hypothetical protein
MNNSIGLYLHCIQSGVTGSRFTADVGQRPESRQYMIDPL